MDLLLDEAALAKLPSLRPRDCDYVALDVTFGWGLFAYLATVSPVACLLGASVAGPELREGLVRRLGGDHEANAACAFLSGSWLPEGPVPHVGEPLVSWLEEIALGFPGEPVVHGKTPSRVTKLARLLRAKAGAYPRKRILEAARNAYEGEYNAHDAVACAFVAYPGEALRVAGELVASRTKSSSIRKQTAEVVMWARRAGYVEALPPVVHPTIPPPLPPLATRLAASRPPEGRDGRGPSAHASPSSRPPFGTTEVKKAPGGPHRP